MAHLQKRKERGIHVIAVHVVGLMMVVGILGSVPGPGGEFFGFFRKLYTLAYGNPRPAPTYTVKSGGSMLNATAPADTSTGRDPINIPPPPPPIP